MASLSNPEHNPHIVVIGAGLAGLAAAYDLARQGNQVTLLEKQGEFGGLASSINLEGHAVERFYHFICRGDEDLIRLANELSLGDKLHWQQTSTAFYAHQRLYRFGTPLDLLQFDCIPWPQRFRFGLHVLSCRYRSHWQALDQVPARAWLIRNIGPQAYTEIWHPLLKVKFGDYYDKISAAWIWHRIWRVAKSRPNLLARESFGYLEDGSSTLYGQIVKNLSALASVRLCLGTPVEKIILQDGKVSAVQAAGEPIPCDGVISTVAPQLLARFFPDLGGEYFSRLKSIQSIGLVCMLFSLKTPFSQYYWTNVNDPRIKFNGMIELTNLNLHLASQGMHLLYIPFYLPTTDLRFQQSDRFFYDEYVQALKILNPSFSEAEIKEWRVFRDPYAQAICTTGFANLVPEVRSPIRGLYVTDSSQFYPEDRTLSAAIRQGRKAVRLLKEDGL